MSEEKLAKIKEFFPRYDTDDLEEVQILLINLRECLDYVFEDLTQDQIEFVNKEIYDFCDLMDIKGVEECEKVKVFIYSIL